MRRELSNVESAAASARRRARRFAIAASSLLVIAVAGSVALLASRRIGERGAVSARAARVAGGSAPRSAEDDVHAQVATDPAAAGAATAQAVVPVAARRELSLPRAAAPVPDAHRYQPSRHAAPVTPGLTPEAKRLWENEGSTTHDIDQAYALDVCACGSLDCISGLQAAFYERRNRALPATPAPEEEAAIRKMRNECHAHIARVEMAANH